MKCEGHPELLQQYIDNELNEVETLLLEDHLRNCSSCRRELNQLILVDWQLHRLKQHIEIPDADLSMRREAALEEFFKAEDVGDIKDLYHVQISAMKNSVEFMQYLPGTKLGRKLGNAGKDYVNNKLKSALFSRTGR
ncbi:MAG: zf-HC2 domain-containing protein [Syntrophomonadaceae bacterium]|nr:zf-HC2 domain-containing protein [Syntrophomonadaceae bacterium]